MLENHQVLNVVLLVASILYNSIVISIINNVIVEILC